MKRLLFFLLGFFLIWSLLFNCSVPCAYAEEKEVENKGEVYQCTLYLHNDTPFPMTYVIVRNTIVPFYRERDLVYAGWLDRYGELSFRHECGDYILVLELNNHFIAHPYKTVDWKDNHLNIMLRAPMWKVNDDGTGPNTHYLVKPGQGLDDGD